MLNSWKALCGKRLWLVDNKLAFPLLRWMSGKPENLHQCVRINEMFFNIPAKVVISLLSANCKGGFYKYPKASKQTIGIKDKLIEDNLKAIYGWSKKEYEKHKQVIINIDQMDLALFIDKVVGLDKKEAKTLGIKHETTKHKFEDKPTGLMSFM